MLKFHGLKAPSWEELGLAPTQSKKPLPLHAKDVTATLKYDIIDQLKAPSDVVKERKLAYEWLHQSAFYDEIERHLKDPSVRQDANNSLHPEDVKIMRSLGKFAPLLPQQSQTLPVAYCNVWDKKEWKCPIELSRRRVLEEPLINDIIYQFLPRSSYSVQYTTRQKIRGMVARSRGGRQGDYAAWFDQHGLDEPIRRLFAIPPLSDEGLTNDEDAAEALKVLAMGFRPSCRIAQSTTRTIVGEVPPGVEDAEIVDNVLFTGSEDSTGEKWNDFEQRSKSCGAILNRPCGEFKSDYEFCGERYLHSPDAAPQPSRLLGEKTHAKVRAVLMKVRQGTDITLQALQFLAIMGLLFYAMEILAIKTFRFRKLMRRYVEVCRECFTLGYEHKIRLWGEEMQQLRMILQKLENNEPVPVLSNDRNIGDDPTDYVIYSDASAHGFGAISFSPNLPPQIVEHRWTVNERENHPVEYSSWSEPTGIQRNLRILFPTNQNLKGKFITLYTDHLPLIFAQKAMYPKSQTYAELFEFLDDFETTTGAKVILAFVPGKENPADVLSRKPPPLLNVTSVAGKQIEAQG